jgi:hypothetical protein
MADITYTRNIFKHEDWIDNEDFVQAGGEKGFNQKFHDIEAEFDEIAGVVGDVNTAIKRIQRLDFMLAQPPTQLAANTASAEFPVETYDRTNMPPNVEKVYFATIFPVNGPTNIQQIFLYRTVPGNKISVTVQFFNPNAIPASFSFRIMTLATQV